MAGQFTWFDYVVLILYFGSMAALGPLFRHSAKTTEGYLLGDRSFAGWLVGFSMFATSISSIAFVGYPADGYKTAWYRMTQNYVMPLAILFAAYFFLPFFRRTQITSAYEYLEDRFGPMTRLYASCAFLISQVVRVSLILYLVSVLLYSITGWKFVVIINGIEVDLGPYLCILVGGCITSFYTVLGGIKAVMWTDFIQALVLWGGAFICLGVIIHQLPGGIGQVFETAAEYHKFGFYDLGADGKTLEPVPFWGGLQEKTISIFLIVGLSNWLWEYSANQTVIQRYAASKSTRQAKIAMWVCTAFSLPTWAMFMFTGTALFAFYQQFPDPAAQEMLTGARKAEGILPYFVIKQLPVGLTGLVIAGVLAAAMSSLSSSISAVSAVSLVDIYKRHVAPGRTDQHYVRFAKSVGWFMSIVMIVGASVLYAADSKTLLDVGTILNALTVGGLLGIYCLGFFTTVGDDRAIVVGILCTLCYTGWSALTSVGVVDVSLRLNHNYYTGLISHILIFLIGYTLGALITGRRKGLENLTVWTATGKPVE
ncbi:MAG: sodium/solute symporter [Candidatus Hydrogenedentes bacterium]|nr:sodium/solute symporter [Candidatus Hydrogenedentota bacterium]